MLASTEIKLIEGVFVAGVLVALVGLGILVWAKKHHRGFRPPMTLIVCGVGIVVIASLLNVLLFKTYAGVRVKKNQYYEITSLTTNMHASLASSQAANQPVTPQAKKASRNVTYLIDHLKQPASSRRLAKAAQYQLTQQRHPNITLVKKNYRRIFHRYFTGITDSNQIISHLDTHVNQKINQPLKKPQR